MTFSPHTLVAFGGTVGSAPYQDVWQCGIRLVAHDYVVGGSGGPLNDPASYLGAITSPLNSWWSTPVTSTANWGTLRNDAKLSWVKVNNIAPSGKYADPANVHTYTYASPASGNGTPQMPPMITIAASFSTDRARGRASKGRIYLPLAPGWVSTPYIAPNDQANILAKVQALLHIFTSTSTTLDATPRPAVCSKLDGSVGIINGIRIGNVVDTQRRRKNAFAESYSVGPLT